MTWNDIELKFRNVWIICHYAQQPPLNTMLRYHNWGKELVKRGCEVTIVAASTIHNTDIDMVEQLGATESNSDGVRYLYIKTPRYSGNGIQRIKNMLSFCFGLEQYAKAKPDVLINCGAYLFPVIKHFFRGIPIITDTVDLWPASIIEYANFSERNLLVKALYWLEKNAYLKSNALIFSIEGGEEYLRERKYASKIDFAKVFHINMGCDIEECDRNRGSIRVNLPWDMSKFNLVYCGSIRQANQVKQLCIAAQEIEKRGIDDVVLQIYGNGNELESIKEYVAENKIKNVNLYGRIEKAKIPYILANSKANILTYKQVHLMKYGGSQSKLFDYLSSGRPIICNAKFGYNLIERHNCGLVTENQSAEAFANTVEELYHMPLEKIDEMGKNSRAVAEMYDQHILVDSLCRVINFAISMNQFR